MSISSVRLLKTPITNAVVSSELLRNHKEHHIFFGNSLHNHYPHVLLSEFALGASDDRLKKEWNNEKELVRMPPRKNLSITEANWREFIGDQGFYPNYLDFFDEKIKKDGILPTVIKYVFDDALFPSMLAGIYHPLIHAAFGVEFESDLVTAEGLAEGCVHRGRVRPLFTFASTPSSSSSKTLAQLFQEIHNDKGLRSSVEFNDPNKINTSIELCSNQIVDYANQFSVQPTQESIRNALEEVCSSAVDVYALTAFNPSLSLESPQDPSMLKEIQLDFFLMHILTSSLSLRVMVPHLDVDKAVKLIRCYVSEAMMYYLARGSPQMNPKALDVYVSTLPFKGWSDIIQLATQSFELHVPKVIRTLLLHCDLFGKDDEKRGGKNETNSKWFKVGAMTADWMVTKKHDWGMNAIGFKEAWKSKSDK